MTTLRAIAELAAVRGPVALAIGFFDGVHLGHRAVLQRACNSAAALGGSAIALTFDPHPARVLRPGASPALLTSTAHKLRIFSTLGVSRTLVVEFTAGFAATPPAEFIRALAGACDLREICVGEDWAFGKGRAGNITLLRELGTALGFVATGIPGVAVDGQPVSSTAIRAAVQAGDLATAARLLGRDFSVLGTVIEGNRLGRKLGFPTANIRPDNEQLPPNGVYAVTASARGNEWRGVANIGVRPTVAAAEKELLLEAHLFDFSGDLYGAEMDVRFLRHLRTEQKFPSLEALREQIARDCEAALAVAD